MPRQKEVELPPEVAPENKLCDPCRVVDHGAKVICGWVGKSLGPHLKRHKLSGGKIWTMERYRQKFPKASIGKPSYSPPPEAIDKWRSANPNAIETSRVATIVDDAAEKKLQERIEEFWNMVERDPAAKMTCVNAAKDEIVLQEAYDELDKLRKASRPDSEKLKFVNTSIDATNKRYNESLKSLSLTVEQRRKANTLGTDAVSQIVGGYANTLRKMSAEKQDAFLRRVDSVMTTFVERVRVSILAEVEDGFNQAAEVVDDNDFLSAILKFNPDKN